MYNFFNLCRRPYINLCVQSRLYCFCGNNFNTKNIIDNVKINNIHILILTHPGVIKKKKHPQLDLNLEPIRFH